MDQEFERRISPQGKRSREECVLPPSVSIRAEVATAAEACSRLLGGTSLNSFNHQTLSLLSARMRTLAEEASLENGIDVAKTWEELREWLLFTISNQNYCSPAHLREDAIFQGGAIRIPIYAKYLRSELNTSLFNGGYDRNIVIIRSLAAESFADFVAQYVAAVETKESRAFHEGETSLAGYLSDKNHQCMMTIVSVYGKRGLRYIEELKDFLSRKEGRDFEGCVYLRVDGILTDGCAKELENTIKENGGRMQILVEEDYDPLASPPSGMKRITFIHNEIDARRYQLIQDGASMGYRPILSDVIDYYLRSGRLVELLDTVNKTEDHIIKGESDDRAKRHGADIDERNRDYHVLKTTLDHCRETLRELEPQSPLEENILKAAVEEAESVRETLRKVLIKRNPEIRDVAEVFHRSYYRVRTLAQYTAMLSERLDGRDAAEVEKCISEREGGLVVAANSGMSAARTVITSLAKKADKAYSTPHYWETDFLIENVLGINPHYPEVSRHKTARLELIAGDLSAAGVDSLAEEIVAENKLFPGGQLICADRSISPFFYTRVFDLETLAAGLARRAAELENPVYLVVDNTLDFDSVYAESLFPSGIPQNVFLIFTPSQAKLHQLGFDAVTGGVLQIHNHESGKAQARELAQQFRAALAAEGCLQSVRNLHFLDLVFYRRYDFGSMTEYVDYMLRKRHRNTRELNERIESCVGPHFESVEGGRREYRGRTSDTKRLLIPDPNDSARTHSVEVAFHFEPASCIHSYISVVEPEPEGTFIAGPILEEMKRRIYKLAAGQGLHLADGTSWGFHVTRLDYYMHTLRIAVGLEHRRNVARLGTLIGSVLKELVLYPGEFLQGVEVCTLDRKCVSEKTNELLALDRLIPQDPKSPTPIEYYLEARAGRYDFSFAVVHRNKLAAMLLSYVEQVGGESVAYISKTATASEFQGRAYFRRMLEHLKDRARAEGINRIVLQTSASERNEYVVKAYEKCGFTASNLRAEMLPNGWPLILVDMELLIAAPATSSNPHFTSVPARVYEAVYAGGDLAPFEKYRNSRFPGPAK